MHDISSVHQAKSNATVDRRSDVGVRQLEFLVVDLGLIGLNRAFRLAYGRLLRIKLLFRDHAILIQRLIAGQIDFSRRFAMPRPSRADLAPGHSAT